MRCRKYSTKTPKKYADKPFFAPFYIGDAYRNSFRIYSLGSTPKQQKLIYGHRKTLPRQNPGKRSTDFD